MGVNFGSAWAPVSYQHNETAGVGGAIVTTEAFSTKSKGFSGGVQANWQYQFANSWLLGVDAMYSWHDKSASAQTNLNSISRTRETHLGNIFSVAGRLGYGWGPTLFYAKGGYAISELGFSNILNATGDVVGESSAHANGYALGGGFEYSFDTNWSIAGEYNLYNFRPGAQQQRLDGTPVEAFNDNIKFEVHQTLIKMNYRFAGG
jgi:outer membrane immunogenic protein